MTDSKIQTHLAEIDNDLCFKTGLEIKIHYLKVILHIE